ncbi:MAG: phage major capsid protein [Patescibacteria group bacterium]|nr:phage major capsid protein [Patescibacteria group bacterium]
MPIPGQGAVPTGALYNELTAVNRRAFVPRNFVQIYFATPSLFYMIGNAKKSAGGLSQITIPIQAQSMVQGQFTGYGGGFNSPTIIPGLQNAQFSTAYWVVPVPLPFGETVIQATDREISLLEARMNDVYSVTVQNMGRLMYTNNTANSLLPDSFQNAFDNGTNFPTYGGINRTTAGNTAWQGQYYSASAYSSGFTRQIMSQYLIQITDAAGGEAPTFVVMNPSDYATLNNDFIGTEQVFVDPGNSYSMGTPVRSAFPNWNVSGVPIFADHFCPKGNAFVINTKYTAMYLSEDAQFDFSGFYSLVPLGQIGQQGVMVTGYDIVTAKPSANAWITGIANPAF